MTLQLKTDAKIIQNTDATDFLVDQAHGMILDLLHNHGAPDFAEIAAEIEAAGIFTGKDLDLLLRLVRLVTDKINSWSSNRSPGAAAMLESLAKDLLREIVALIVADHGGEADILNKIKLVRIVDAMLQREPGALTVSGLARKLLENHPQGRADRNKRLPAASTPGMVLPTPDGGGYEKWAERVNKKEQPLAFLLRVWGGYIDADAMRIVDLRGSRGRSGNKGLDKTLYDQCVLQCAEEGKTLADYLPDRSWKTGRKRKA